MTAALAIDQGQIAWGEQVTLHFIGFRGDEYGRATRVFGKPGFIHIGQTPEARPEVFSGDVTVFVTGTVDDEPPPYSYPDLYGSSEERS